MAETGFAHLGWFPFCPDEVEVSTYDYWVTLGGTRKGSAPTEAQIAQSLVNASEIFWNMKGLNYLENGSPYSSTQSDPVTETKPISRLCLGNEIADRIYYDTTTSPIFTLECGGEIIRMLDNGTFVGYGVRGYGSIGSGFAQCAFIPLFWLDLFSYENTTSPENINYTQMGNYHFVCRAYDSATGGDPVNRTITDGTNSIQYTSIDTYTYV